MKNYKWNEFIKNFAYIWNKERSKSLSSGSEICKLKGDGIALYITRVNSGIVLHRYKDGEFLNQNCKKTLCWEKSNSIWIIGFKDIREAEEFASTLKEELKSKFGKSYSFNYCGLCCREK